MSALDLIALTIALGSACALVITTAVQNARLTRSRDEWKALAMRQCQECWATPTRPRVGG